MKILGISSATNTISVGLIDEDKILAELTFSGKEAFTEDLIVYIKKIIDETGVKPDVIAVTEGPGSYSGLRGGLATAKTLAQVLNLPVVGVSTLEAIAYNHIDSEGAFAAATHAKRDEYNFALFASDKNKTLKRLTRDLVISSSQMEKFSHIQICNDAPRGTSIAFLARNKKDEGFLNLKAKYSHKPNIRTFNK